MLSYDSATLPRTGCQAEVAAHLAPIAEVAEEHLVAQHRGEREPDAAQLRQPGGGAVLRLRNPASTRCEPGSRSLLASCSCTGCRVSRSTIGAGVVSTWVTRCGRPSSQVSV